MFAREPNKGSTANAKVSFVSALWRGIVLIQIQNGESCALFPRGLQWAAIAHRLPSNLWTICRNFDVIAVFWVRMLF